MHRIARLTLAVSLLAVATALASRTSRAQGYYGYRYDGYPAYDGRYRPPVIVVPPPPFSYPPPPPPPRVIYVLPRPVYPPFPYGW